MSVTGNIAISQTPPKWKWVLEAYGTPLECDTDPIEWEDCIFKIERDIEIGGVTKILSIDTLTFVGNAAEFLQNIFDTYEIEGICSLTVYKLKVMSYVPYSPSYSIDFGTYKKGKIGDFSFGVNVACQSSSLTQKLENRKGVDINILKNKSIGEMTLPSIVNFYSIKYLTIPEIASKFVGKLSSSGDYPAENDEDDDTMTIIPLNKSVSDFTELRSQIYRTLLEINGSFLKTYSFFKSSTVESRTVAITFTIVINVVDGGGIFNKTPYALQIARIDASNNIVETQTYIEFGQHSEVRTYFYKDQPFTLDGGDSLCFYLKVKGSKNIGANITSCRLTISESTSSPLDETQIEGMPIYESFMRVCQMMFDRTYCFYSDFFGRKDVTWNGTDYYSEENVESFAHLQSGSLLRAMAIGDKDCSINLTYEKLFKSASCMWGLGYDIELIGGVEYLRVEPYSYWFKDETILDLTGRINNYDIESEYMPDFSFVEIVNGFESFTYEKINGRAEYNTEITRTISINSSESMDLKSDIRGDQVGIINCIENPIDSEDGDSDTDVYIIKTQRLEEEGNDSAWIAETNEIITVEDSSSLWGDASMNLYFSPSRCLRRNAHRFMPSLYKFLTKKLVFQTSDKDSNLKTTGEGYTITENEDISVNDLPTPIFKAMKHYISINLTDTELALIEENPYSKIKINSNLSVYLLSLSKKINENKVTIEGIEAI
jgi:hypothetical protein